MIEVQVRALQGHRALGWGPPMWRDGRQSVVACVYASGHYLHRRKWHRRYG